MKCLVFFTLLVFAQGDELLVRTPSSSGVSSRIVGGTATTVETYPYIVQVLYSSQPICGGNVLTTTFILSAAHCFVNEYSVVLSPSYFSIRAGTTYLNTGGEVRSVSAIFVHESYNVPARDNDIALLALTSALTYSTAVQPSYIPPQAYEVADDVDVIHVGWGRTNVNVAGMSTVLQHVTSRTVNRTLCASRYELFASIYGGEYPVTTNMVCAGLLGEGGKDACQGDSGGPMVYGDVVVGLTSWGYSCGDPTFPGVNTRVASYTTWINSTVTRFNKGSTLHTSTALLSLSLLASITVLLNKSS